MNELRWGSLAISIYTFLPEPEAAGWLKDCSPDEKAAKLAKDFNLTRAQEEEIKAILRKQEELSLNPLRRVWRDRFPRE